MLVRRFLVGAVAAAFVLSGCGGADEPTAATTPAAPATTSAAAPGDPTESGFPDLPGGIGNCLALAQTASNSLSKVAEAGLDYDKAGAEYKTGAAAVRAKLAELTELPAAARKAAEDIAAGMDEASTTVSKVAAGDIQPYLDAQKKVGNGLVELSSNCN